MTTGRAVQMFGLEVPAGDEPTPIVEFGEYPATIRLTMAALNPLEKVDGAADEFKGAVLKIIRIPEEDEDDDDSEDGYDDDMAHLLDEDESDEDDEEEVSELNGDDAKPSKASKVAALKAAVNGDSMEVDGAVAKKGKKVNGGAATEEDEDDDEDLEDLEDDSDDEDELPIPEEFILCTLDTKQHYQQTIDITVDERETVFFQVTGTHTVYLTGNIIMPPMDDYEDSEDDEDDEDDSDYDLSPDESELREEYDEDVSDSEDALDDLDEPRITEVDEEDAPALVAAPAKGKNKRVAEDDSMVDASMASATSATSDADKPLSKSQKKKLAKKLKDNSGNAVEAPKTEEPASASKSDKKVQFKEGLVQGPTPSGNASTETKETKETKESKSASGPRTVGGVTIDDRKVGSGPGAKKGDRISMRYIGKLEKDKKVFDSNKKGKPFSFVLGKGEVIKGWDIGVAGMQAGGERRLTIPAKLAYGSKAIPDIPANSTLVFDVKLLEIK